MPIPDLMFFALYAALILVLTPVLGNYMAKVFTGERTILSPVLRPVEIAIYRLSGISETGEQHWTRYAGHLLGFSFAGLISVYAVLRLQHFLPLNPEGLANVAPDLAFNTAVSFITNTNWQAYGGESTMSYLSQMVALAVHNFLSAATGLAVAIALIRALVRRTTKSIGNFYVDLTRGVLYLLLPISILGALVLVWQGVPQNLNAYAEATTLEGARQVIAQGPVASQEIIKELGTNGGGFFNANSAHPYENPTPLSNFLEDLLIFLVPASLIYTYGRMIGNKKQAASFLGAMGVLFLLGLACTYLAEATPNPALSSLPLDMSQGNMEGKEVRFGLADSVLWAVTTTATSCGAVNAMHDSLMPLAGMVPLINMMLGCIIFGGVGAGFYGMLLYVILAVFIAGLMVGRTPEYLGKKIEAREVKLAVFALFSIPVGVLVFTAFAAVLPAGLGGISNAGPHGFTQILYAFTSADANNGSAFAGLAANTLFYNSMLATVMLIGRFVIIIPMLAIAGSFAAKKTVPLSTGTFPTDNGLFVALLVSVILIIGGLTFFPALALGPIAEHLALFNGALF
jgi:K+-transporting ATPase ATPase A chain